MLKTRVIPILLWRDHSLVKGVSFDSTRVVGTILPAVKLYTMRDVDELMLLDVTATQRGGSPNLELVEQVAADCNVPLTVGGGITSVQDMRALLLSGADKVAIGTALYSDPGLLTAGADRFGAQCLVASIDFQEDDRGQWMCYSHCGKQKTEWSLVEWAHEVERRGAGEILLTSIARDGCLCGYDVEAVRAVTNAVSVPVIASGGAGSYEDCLKAILKGNASAVAASSMFQFTQQTPRGLKSYLAKNGVLVRN